MDTDKCILEVHDYADDTALLSHYYQDMLVKTDALPTTARSFGLKINVNKRKKNLINGRTSEAIALNGEAVEEVDHFTYLESKLLANRDGEKEIQARISEASQVFGLLQSIWRSKNISQKTRSDSSRATSKALYHMTHNPGG